MASNQENQALRTQRIADGDQELSWQLCFEESEDLNFYILPLLLICTPIYNSNNIKNLL